MNTLTSKIERCSTLRGRLAVDRQIFGQEDRAPLLHLLDALVALARLDPHHVRDGDEGPEICWAPPQVRATSDWTEFARPSRSDTSAITIKSGMSSRRMRKQIRKNLKPGLRATRLTDVPISVMDLLRPWS